MKTGRVHACWFRSIKDISSSCITSMMGHTSLKMLISNYGKYLADKNKTINRSMSIFQESEPSTDYSTDSEVLAK